MEVNAADVKKLRDRTGMQMMKCKAALIQAGGDMEKAIEIIRLANKNVQVSTASRETTEGRIGVYIDPVKKVGAIVELRCESSPVAKNELFVRLANDVAKQIALTNPDSSETLLAQAFVDEPGKTVNERIGDIVGLMRENIKPARMARMEGNLGEYVHHDGTVGVLLQVEGAKNDPVLLRDVCMHIAAKNPLVALRDHMPKDKIDKETEIARAQAEETGKNKPPDVIEKIAEGRLRTWFAENVLAEQPFVKDDKKTVEELLSGAGLKLVQFARLRVGEVSA
jgi:elongation factor Ts